MRPPRLFVFGLLVVVPIVLLTKGLLTLGQRLLH